MSFETLSLPRAEAAWGALAQHVRPGRMRDLALEQAIGAVLAADAPAAMDYPPYDRAVMDGYAVRAADVAGAPARLRLGGLVPAGAAPSAALESGTCIQINTGAVVPGGADAIVPVEDAAPGEDGRVVINEAPRPGQHIERRGAICAPGDVLAPAGTRIGCVTAAALAAGGVARVRVFARPQVALVTTGSELVEQGSRLQHGQIHETNSLALSEQITRAGGEVLYQGRCADEPAALHAALELGLAHDVLVVTGGMSKGTHDLAPAQLERLGVQWLVSGLDLKPGKPTRIGRGPSGCWVLGLPGNPVSCAVCFALFGAPLLAGLQGLAVRPPAMLSGGLDEPMKSNGLRPMFQPGLWRTNGLREACVRPLAWRGSGDPFGLARANALIYRPSNAPPAVEGERVSFVVLDTPAP